MAETESGVAVVTGAASGIGEACAERFSRDGYTVAVIDCNGDGAKRVEAALTESGADARAFVCDVTDHARLGEVAEAVERDLGPVAALVTSAGILNNPDRVTTMDLDEHARVWDVNYNGTLHAVRAFAPAMEGRGRGAIVTVGSVNSFIALPLPAYNPAKAALKRLTELLAMECGHFGLRVNGVAPNYTMTPAIRERIEQGLRDPENIRRSGAVHMLIEPHHVASAVAFLASDEAAAIAGVMLPVDAGYICAAHYQTFAGGMPWDD